MTHSTVSPAMNSMAWATAEGTQMCHCSRPFRSLHWTLVVFPMAVPSTVMAPA